MSKYYYMNTMKNNVPVTILHVIMYIQVGCETSGSWKKYFLSDCGVLELSFRYNCLYQIAFVK